MNKKLNRLEVLGILILSLVVLAGFYPLNLYKISPAPTTEIKQNLHTLAVYARKATVYDWIETNLIKTTELIKLSENSENLSEFDYQLTVSNAKRVALTYTKTSFTTKSNGLLVTKVDNMSDFKSYLQTGDVITKINDNQLNNEQALTFKKGDEVTIHYLRHNKEKTETKTLTHDDLKLAYTNLLDFKTNNETFNNDTMATTTNVNGSSVGLIYSVYYILLLQNKQITKPIAMTGTIDDKGNVGKIAGIKEKLISANKSKIKYVFVPFGNIDEAKQVKAQFNLNIELYPVSSLNDTMNYLTELNLTK